MVKDILIDNKPLYNFELYFLKYFSIVTKISIGLILFGFFQKKPAIIMNINYIVKILLGVFLVYRFNKYRKYKITFTELDRKVSYSAGMYILIISFGEYVLQFSEFIREKLSPIKLPIGNLIKQKFTKIYNNLQQ